MLNATTVRFVVTVPNNQYFSLGFGKTMTNCDMVIWQANGLANSNVLDLYSYGETTPLIDKQQDYVSTKVYNGTHVIFTSDRKINTGD